MLEQAEPLISDQQQPAAASIAPLAKPRLLVIDDDKLHRMIICRAAAKAGYAPAGAATYDEAIKFSQKAAFDCIALDLSSGPNAGVEMLQHFWLSGYKAPIIVITGCDPLACAETLKLAKSLQLNIRETISKPVDLALLNDLLERLKGERETAAAVSA